MLLAEAVEAAKRFEPFDIIMILFTVLIFIGLLRLASARVKNKFALGFTTVSLLVFLVADYVMITESWLK